MQKMLVTYDLSTAAGPQQFGEAAKAEPEEDLSRSALEGALSSNLVLGIACLGMVGGLGSI